MDSGGKPKPKLVKGVPVDYKFPPKRTPREWRAHTAQKLRQYEMIAWDGGRKGEFRGSGRE